MPIDKKKCKRCGYEWYPRTPINPVQCPSKKCHSPYWNIERRVVAEKTAEDAPNTEPKKINSGKTETHHEQVGWD